MTIIKSLAIAAAGACIFAVPTASQARSSYGFSISTGPSYYGGYNYYAPRPYVYAPPPVPIAPAPVYYRPYYRPAYYGGYYNAGPSFSFSYHD